MQITSQEGVQYLLWIKGEGVEKIFYDHPGFIAFLMMHTCKIMQFPAHAAWKMMDFDGKSQILGN